MFNVGPAEMAVLAILAVVVFGPDRLPTLAKQAAQMLRTVREMSTNARKQLGELSPGLDESLRDLDLGSFGKGGGKFNAKSALQKMIFEDDEPAAAAPPSTAAVTMDEAERAGPSPVSAAAPGAAAPAGTAAPAGAPTPPVAVNAADDIT